MGLNAHILTITEPTIKVENIAAVDMGQREGGDNFDAGAGVVPYIRVNNYLFQDNEIQSFTLRLTDKYPEISAVLVDTRDIFAVSQMPRDFDVLSLRLKGRGDKYKDIRMDFHILEFRGIPTNSAKSADGGSKYNVKAIAKLPGLYEDVCKSFGKASSYDHLIKIAEEMQLGFATNVEYTDDEMVRLCAYQSRFDAISETVLHSYISDNTFQTYSVDPYYYLNFVDVQKLFDAEEDIEMAELKSEINFKERAEDSSAGDEGTPVKLILTNHTNASSTANYIKSYNLTNNSTQVSLENGYKRYLQYYDVNADMSESNESLNEFFVEALVSSTMKDNEEPLKGRRNSENDEYNQLVKHKYIGLQDSSTENGNVHLNWAYSAVNNIQNMAELSKMKLTVTLAAINPAVYRYMKIPVTIYNYSTNSAYSTNLLNEKAREAGFETKNPEDENQDAKSKLPDQPVADEFLTGYYVVMGVEYTFTEGKYNQVLHLARKEWPARINTV